MNPPRALLAAFALATLSSCTHIAGLEGLDYELGVGGAGGEGGGAGGSAATGGQGPEPFWQFRSADLSSDEIDAFNDPDNGVPSLNANDRFQFDLDDPHHWISMGSGTAVRVDDDGLLHAALVDDAEIRATVHAWANGAGSPKPPIDRSMSLDRRYRMGMDIFVPADASDWLDTTSPRIYEHIQHTDDEGEPSNRGDPFRIDLRDPGSGPRFYLSVHGDAAEVFDGDYDFQILDVSAPLTRGLGEWYRFEMEAVWSYEGRAELAVWIDGELLYQNDAASDPSFVNCFNDRRDGERVGLSFPGYGLRLYGAATPLEIHYDNMWIADLGSVP